MTDYTASRLGMVNSGGDAKALFLKLFAGEILTAFETENLMLGMTNVRSIPNGKSASFPVTAEFTAAYHTPGNEITGSAMNHNEVVITIDDLLIANTFIANIDEAMNHYDVRSEYSRKLGYALANTMDKHLIATGVLAARASGIVTGRSGGSVIGETFAGAPASADFEDNGSHLAAALFLAAQELDNKNAPSEGRYCIVRPKQYYKLVQSTDTINRDWGGAGAYSDGKVFRVAGIDIVKSNNLPSTDLSADTSVLAGTGNKYRGNFLNTVGLVFQRDAVGTVKLLDLAVESEYQISRQGTLMVAKYAVGHGVLRPECAVEIRATTII